MRIPIDDQIACVTRELGFRSKVYPRWVANGKLTQDKADLEMARMRAVKRSLLSLKAWLVTLGPGSNMAEVVSSGANDGEVDYAWCPKCGDLVVTIDAGETCARCKLVL